MEAFGQVGDGRKTFREVSDCAKAFCEVGDGAFCEVGDGAEVLCEVGDGAKLDWSSPRISFSEDLTMAAGDGESSNATAGIRVFPEKRKWQEEEEEGEHDDGYSTEFQFSNNGVSYGCLANQSKGMMLSADELFSDGKLLPLHLQRRASSFSFSPCSSSATANHGDLCAHPNKQEPHHNKLLLQKSHRIPMASRHLSFELPKPSPSITLVETSPSVSLSVDNSPCSSPPRPSPSPSRSSPLSTTSISPKVSFKYSFKIKDFFKPKRVVSATAQLTRDNSTTSTCRIPIPPRSFWPFSRSNSAGESKTTTPPPPTLPPRSNSAGESNTARASPASKSPHEVQNGEHCNTSSRSHLQDSMVSSCRDTLHSSNFVVPVDSASSNQVATSPQQPDQSISNTAGTFQNARKSTVVNTITRVRASGSPGRASRKKYMNSTGSFSRGSPGRRGAMNPSAVKVNAGRIVLRNLERCSAEKTFCRESLGRRSSYPVAVRVTPVLNVAIYKGKMPKSGMFGLGSLFSSKKEKGKEKPVGAAMNNWRVGA